MSRFLLPALLLPAVLLAADVVAPREAVAAPAQLPEWALSFATDAELTDERRAAIQHDARAYATSASPEARRQVLERLTRAPACGRAHAAALAGVLSAGVEPSDVASAVGTMSTACDEVIVETAGFVPNPDRAIANALLARTNDADDAVRRAAWLSYGSIAETARTRGDGELARSLDVTLASGLASTTGEEHLLRVRAAGNAGCEACAGALAKDAASTDDTLRRAAVAAHRFLTSTDAVTRMCGALEADADASTRDLAAWALEWRTTSPADRARCLEKAAITDASAGVRLQAVRALGVLSDDADEAHESLARLAERHGKVGELATRTLSVRVSHEDPNQERSLEIR